MKRKGIESVISVIILLFITVALLGVAWTSLSALIGQYTEEQFHVPETLAYCQYGTIDVYATTPNEILNSNSFIITQLINSEGNAVSGFNITTSVFPLKKGQQAKKIVSFNCGGSGCSGTYTIILGTSKMRVTRTVTCS